MPLDPWIIEEIKKREEEERRRQEEQQPRVPADDPREMPEPRDEREMPSERKPGYEMPNPNEPSPAPVEKKKDDEPKRGVDISRITGGDEEDDGTIDIAKALKKIEEQAPPEKSDDAVEKPSEKKPD